MTQQGGDERRIGALLRRLGVGPDALPPPARPEDEPTHERDWLDRLYEDQEQPEHDAGEQRTRWHSLGRTTPAPASSPGAPAIEVAADETGYRLVINQPAAAGGISPHRARMRRWILHRGTAAAAGWGFGLGHLVTGALTDAGPGALGVAALLYLVAWLVATRLLRLVPSAATEEVHTAADWAAHIPDATVLLALALHTPTALVGVTS